MTPADLARMPYPVWMLPYVGWALPVTLILFALWQLLLLYICSRAMGIRPFALVCKRTYIKVYPIVMLMRVVCAGLLLVLQEFMPTGSIFANVASAPYANNWSIVLVCALELCYVVATYALLRKMVFDRLSIKGWQSSVYCIVLALLFAPYTLLVPSQWLYTIL